MRVQVPPSAPSLDILTESKGQNTNCRGPSSLDPLFLVRGRCRMRLPEPIISLRGAGRCGNHHQVSTDRDAGIGAMAMPLPRTSWSSRHKRGPWMASWRISPSKDHARPSPDAAHRVPLVCLGPGRGVHWRLGHPDSPAWFRQREEVRC